MAISDELKLIFDKIDVPKEYVEFLLQNLYKYKDDPVIKTVVDIVNENKAQIDNFYDIIEEEAEPNGKKVIEWEGTKALMMLTPKDPLSLRVYPEIPVTNATKGSFTDFDNSNCIGILKDFIKEYEAGTAEGSYLKERWQPLERVQKRLNNYLDMPTAKALTRFANLNVKDNLIRDFADRIDTYRKPMELLFATKPEDFYKMYTNGPPSCMTTDHDKFVWMADMKLAPTSIFASFPNMKGAYIKKNGKVAARAMVFNHGWDKGKEDWYWGRIYSTSPEYTKKFTQTLMEAGIKDGSGQRHDLPKGYSFKTPAFKRPLDGAYFLPVGYHDNMDQTNWSAKYDPGNQEFTIEYYSKNPGAPLLFNGTNGFVLATHYMTMHCSLCEKVIKGISANILSVKGAPEKVFCGDNCAHEEGYIKIYNGNNNSHYQRYDEVDNDLVGIVGVPNVKFSNLRAAESMGKRRYMPQAGVLVEEGDIKVVTSDHSHQFNVTDHNGDAWAIDTPHLGMPNGNIDYAIPQGSLLKTNKIPIEVVKQKTVLYDADEYIVKEAVYS